MYPDFIQIAKDENLKDIARLFSAIGKVGVKYESEYLTLKQVLIGEGFFNRDQDEYCVCEVCLLDISIEVRLSAPPRMDTPPELM